MKNHLHNDHNLQFMTQANGNVNRPARVDTSFDAYQTRVKDHETVGGTAMNLSQTINPFYRARTGRPTAVTASAPAPVRYARLPRIPISSSPVPRLTSLYHFHRAGEYGDRSYPGNCGGNLIKDLITFFGVRSVFDPMTGSGTCRDVCRELGVYCWSTDLRQGADACDASQFPRGCFEFAWIHPPYWRQKLYTNDPRDLSQAPSLDAFLERYRLLIENCAGALLPGGRLAVLMGDYSDREAGYVPLTYHTKRLAFEAGLRQCCTDIIRFSHGASSGKKVYRSSFIPGLHDTCVIFEMVGAATRARPTAGYSERRQPVDA